MSLMVVYLSVGKSLTCLPGNGSIVFPSSSSGMPMWHLMRLYASMPLPCLGSMPRISRFRNRSGILGMNGPLCGCPISLSFSKYRAAVTRAFPLMTAFSALTICTVFPLSASFATRAASLPAIALVASTLYSIFIR